MFYSELIIKEEPVEQDDANGNPNRTTSFTDLCEYQSGREIYPTPVKSHPQTRDSTIPWKIVKRENTGLNLSDVAYSTSTVSDNYLENDASTSRRQQCPSNSLIQVIHLDEDKNQNNNSNKKPAFTFKMRLKGREAITVPKEDHTCYNCGKKFLYNYRLVRHRIACLTKTVSSYTCDMCNLSFTHSKDYQSHLKTHNTVNYSCQYCDRKFAGLGQLKNHEKMHINKFNQSTTSSLSTCDVCSKVFKTVNALQMHRKSHFTVKLQKCKFCGEEFSNSEQFQAHKLVHFEREAVLGSLAHHMKTHPKTYPCSECELQFETSKDLSDHIALHKKLTGCESSVRDTQEYLIHNKAHETTIPQHYTCKICLINFETMEQSNAHKAEHVENGFACQICEQSFKGFSGLLNHTKAHNRGKDFSCKLCESKFVSARDLHTHEKSHPELENKVYSCPICSKVVSGPGQLVQHLKVHNESNVRTKCCIFCRKTFKFSCHLAKHLLVHARPERLYSCDKCNLTFTNSRDFRLHLKSHTTERISEIKIHSCEICPRTFKFASLLNLHMKAHSKETKKLPCHICGKILKGHSPLTMHLKMHAREKFKCGICYRVLKGANQLAIHKKSHENNLKEYFCKTCDEIFLDYEIFQTHLSIHPTVQFVCDLCGKEVSGKGQLAAHKRSHTKTHPCNNCELIFDTSEALIDHKAIHKTLTICPVCSESIRGTREYQIHKKSHEPTFPEQYTCKICSINFETVEQSNSHKAEHVENGFACQICGQSFKGLSGLLNHTKAHNRSKDFSCTLCESKFVSARELQTHEKSHKELENKVYSCSICSKIVSGPGQLYQHLKSHSPAKFNCKICGESVIGSSQIKLHKQKHARIKSDEHETESSCESDHDDGDFKIESGLSICNSCPVCEKSFKFPSILKRHIQTHQTPLSELSCPNCPELKFSSSRELHVHKREHNEKQIYSCETCGKVLKTRSALSQHLKSHNPQMKSCPVCGKVFKFQSIMAIHLKSHSRKPRPSKVYSCEHCDQKFDSSTKWRLHKRTHSLIRYECETCGKSVTGIGQLKMHRKTHMDGKVRTCIFCQKTFKFSCLLVQHLKVHARPERSYSCKNCDLTFKSSTEFRLHKKVHTVERTSEIKIHSCEICSKSFKFSSILKIHMKVHNNVTKMYQCRECDKTFSLKHELGIHSKIHSVRKVFSCEICGKHLSGASPLKMHLKMHAREKFKCDICQRILKGQNQLQMHKRTHENNVKEYFCKTCDEIFLDYNQFQIHQLTHPTVEFICDICGKEVSGASQLTQHKKSHNTIHKCDICDLVVANATDLYEHKKIHRTAYTCDICHISIVGLKEFQLHKKNHVIIIIQYSCKICVIDFENAEQHEEHKRMHIANNFACGECGLTFMGMGPLIAHSRVHTRTESYSCDECSSTFKYAVELYDHQKTHKKAIEKLTCNVCQKVVTSTHLAAHKKTHTRRKYECPVCGKQFSSSGQMTDHKKKHFTKRKNANASTYDCQICNKKFLYKSLLIKHETTHVQNQMVPTLAQESLVRGKICIFFLSLILISVFKCFLKKTNKKRQIHFCRECDSIFGNAHELRVHSKTHDLSPGFLCRTCGTVFTKHLEFVRHKKIHTVQGPVQTNANDIHAIENVPSSNEPVLYSCNFCEETFQNSEMVSSHFTSAHSNLT